MRTILEELEQHGTIVINEKEDEDYTIYTNYPNLVKMVLESFNVSFKEVKYNEPDFYYFDFCLREQKNE